MCVQRCMTYLFLFSNKYLIYKNKYRDKFYKIILYILNNYKSSTLNHADILFLKGVDFE